MELSEESLQSHTSCDTEAERRVLDTLLIIEKDFRKLYKIWNQELSAQAADVDKLWHIIQCYMIAMNVQPKCKCPKLYAIEPEDIILVRYDAHIFNLMESQMEMSVNIDEIRGLVLRFRDDYSKLDLSLHTPFIRGDAFHKPIKFYKELVDDLFNYFYAFYIKLNYSVNQLDPLDLSALESYKEQLQHSEEFEEYLMSSLKYCACLQPMKVCTEKKNKLANVSRPCDKKKNLIRRQQCIERRSLLIDVNELKIKDPERSIKQPSHDVQLLTPSPNRDPLNLVQNWVKNSIGRRSTLNLEKLSVISAKNAST